MSMSISTHILPVKLLPVVVVLVYVVVVHVHLHNCLLNFFATDIAVLFFGCYCKLTNQCRRRFKPEWPFVVGRTQWDAITILFPPNQWQINAEGFSGDLNQSGHLLLEGHGNNSFLFSRLIQICIPRHSCSTESSQKYFPDNSQILFSGSSRKYFLDIRFSTIFFGKFLKILLR